MIFGKLHMYQPQFHLGGEQGIGGRVPSNYGASRNFPNNTTRLYVEGGDSATIMLYGHTPMTLAGFSKLQMTFNALLNSSAHDLLLKELDTMLGMGTCYGNLSMQCFQGQLQIVHGSGSWVNIPGNSKIPWPPPRLDIVSNFGFDKAKETITYVDTTWNGLHVPINQTYACVKSAWAEGPSNQAQITLIPKPLYGAADYDIINWEYILS
jgi:hypothetical protein